MNKLSLIFIIAFLLHGCSFATIAPTSTATMTATEKPTITPALTATVLPTTTPSKAECPKVSDKGGWERYKPNSFENLLTEIDQISSAEKNEGISMYVESGEEYQFPSCVTMEYTGKYQEIPEIRNFLIMAWSGIFGSERGQQIVEMLKHEVLFIDNEKEYWIPIQEPLIPYMERELTENKPATVFIIWIGSSYLGEKTDHVFIIGEFVNPKKQ